MNIDSSLNMIVKKVKNFFLYICSIFQNNSYDELEKYYGLQCAHLAWALKQVDTQFINNMLILTM